LAVNAFERRELLASWNGLMTRRLRIQKPGTDVSIIAQAFHQNVARPFEETHEPCEPVGYQGQQFDSSAAYILKNEEEQHLADNIAFLAQIRSGPRFISAATFEQGFPSNHLYFGWLQIRHLQSGWWED